MENLQFLFDRWAFSVPIVRRLQQCPQKVSNLFAELYMQLIRDFDGYFDFLSGKYEHDMLFSGFSLFYGCVLLISKEDKWSKYLPSLIHYVLLYFLVDHYLDDESEEVSVKKKKMKAIRAILAEQPVVLSDHHLNSIHLVYQRMLQTSPLVKYALLELYDAEVWSVKIQKNADLPLDTYLQLVHLKGGWTTGVVAALAGYQKDSISCKEYLRVGVVVQMFDDILDYQQDRAKNYYNAVHYYISRNKHLQLIEYIADLIEKISNKDNIFRVLSLHMLAYIIDTSPLFSHLDILTPFRIYNIFPRNDLALAFTPCLNKYLLTDKHDQLDLKALRAKTIISLPK